MPQPKIHALSVIAGLANSSGGPTFCVISLTEAVARAGVESLLATVQCPDGMTESSPAPELVQTLRVRGFHFPALRLMWSPTFKAALCRHCRENAVSIIHSHGLWTPPNHAAAVVARELGIPLVISTHGMLEPWAWQHRAWKKRPVWWLWQHRDLLSAAVLHATAPQEVAALRNMGFCNPIALIPNGVDLPKAHLKSEIGNRKSEIRQALFLSRIHPKKGLLNLVAAWEQLRPSGWRMVVCGPDEGGHLEQVKQAVAKAGLTGAFEFLPPVYGLEKDALFARANLFVLPSFSENFGVAVAESLAYSLPVITTKGTPWEELVSRRCGWWIDIGVTTLTAALREATALTDEERLAMGQRGRQLVEENYSWPKIGRDMKTVYEWVLNGGRPPDCVQIK